MAPRSRFNPYPVPMSASTWGNPNATKHALLIHGITSSSHAWHHIATALASRGYFVTAPDLLGHGHHPKRGSDHTIAGLANELKPYFTAARENDPPYDIVVGHSLGGVVASALLPLLTSTRPVRVVLVDPPLELPPEFLAFQKTLSRASLTDPKTPEAHQQASPLCTKEDALFLWLGLRLCDISVAEAIGDQNVPWSFSHLLATAPDNVTMTVLAADPSKGALVKEADLEGYPHVTSKIVWGASHLIPIEAPQVVIETALEGTA